ncbi:MAG: AhpC/TSA family protein [Deltaproteobacteria bacterium]|nr:AhpC/TSA family protein [Deltaproteobacteria bacterium]
MRLVLLSLVLVTGCHRAAEPTAVPAARSKPTSDASPAALGTLAPGTGVPVGERVPDVRAKDLEGRDVALADLYARGPVLLVFYRGGWCPFCNFQIRALPEGAGQFTARGITLAAVSVDRPDEGARTRALYALPFPVLSDPDLAFVEGFHVANRVGEAELARLKAFGMDLEASSGRQHRVIAIPSMFLIDRGGVVRWAHSDPDYKTRPSVAQILAALDALR